MVTLFLDGIRIPYGDILIYVPFTAILAVVAVAVLPHSNVRPRGLLPLIGLSSAVAVSSAILILQGGTGHQIGGLEIVMYAWVGLVGGSVLSIRNGDGIELAGFVLFILISIAFVQAVQSSTISLSWDYFSLTAPDYAFKAKIMTLFGASNYIAAFMLFFFGYGTAIRRYRLILVAGAGLLMTQSRAAILIAGVFGAMVLGATLVRQVLPSVSNAWRLFFVGLVVGAGALAVFAFIYAGASAQQNQNILTLASRTVLWDRSVALIAENPIVGYGNGILIPQFGEDYAHNWFLDVWLSYGVVAACMFGAYVWSAMRGLYLAWRHGQTDGERNNAAAILAGLVLMSIQGFVEPVLFTIPFVLLIGFVATPMLRSILVQGDSRSRQSPQRRQFTSPPGR